MSQCFIDALHGTDVEGTAADAPIPEREKLQVVIVGSRAGVLETIHNLHRRGFAEAGDWSPLLPASQLGEVMSILTRYRLKES